METTVFQAEVLEVRNCQLLVCDCRTRQTVLVHTQQACCFSRAQQACCFSRGDRVEIEYSGAMTMSLPPQVSALCISRGCR